MTWLRVEGATRDPDVSEGLAAALADPLWLLARQWQVGEFHGEDAASPVLVSAEVRATPLSAFAPAGTGETGGVDRVDADRPLEVLVEQEGVDDDVELPLELGWSLLRSLAAAGIPQTVRDRLRQQHPALAVVDDVLDPLGVERLRLLARRSLDGRDLAAAIGAAGGPSQYVADMGLAVPLASEVSDLLAAWLATAVNFVRVPETGSSWISADLEYRFRVAAPAGQATLGLEASGYRGGRLDWFHFRRQADNAPALDAAGRVVQRELTVLPTPLRFNGMPAARFWEIEDRSVSFGDLAAGEEDIARSVIGAFAAVYGEDWMVVPCTLPIGTVARVERLVVHDDFGQAHVIPSTAAADGPDRVWRFFEIEGDDGPDAATRPDRQAPLLVLAPALPTTLEGPAREQVDFRRDEVSNLAWAIERRAVGSAGGSIDRDAVAAGIVDDDDGRAAEWTYDAFRPVAEHWIPFVAAQLGETDAQVHLRRAVMAARAPDVRPELFVPMGRILEPDRPLRVHEEAIPDSGARVERRYQRTRGPDGRVHLWVGRRVRTGSAPARGRFRTDALRKPRSRP